LLKLRLEAELFTLQPDLFAGMSLAGKFGLSLLTGLLSGDPLYRNQETASA
jgi:hypothetical protein